MTTFDVLLIVLGLCIVGLMAYLRTVKALFMLGGVYLSTLVSAMLYQGLAHGLSAIGQGELWFEGLVFILLFFIVFIVFLAVLRASFPDSSLPKIGALDYVLGGLVGVVVAVIVLLSIYGGVWVMVSEYWEPYQRYAQIQMMYSNSLLGPYLRLANDYYLYAFYPFFAAEGFPPAMMPR